MLFLAVIAAGCGSTSVGVRSNGPTTSPTQRSSVIAWVEATATAPRAAPTTTTTTLPTGPACETSTLRTVAKPGGVGLGNDLEIVVVTNVGPTTCWVGGYPSLAGVKPSGTRSPTAFLSSARAAAPGKSSLAAARQVSASRSMFEPLGLAWLAGSWQRVPESKR